MDAARRRRFIAWHEATFGTERGAKKSLMDETGKHGHPAYSKGRITQFFDPSEPFGEDAAVELALRLGKPPNFFLVDHVAEPTAEYLVSGLADLLRINPETHERVVVQLTAMIEGARASDQLLAAKSKKGYVSTKRAAETLGKATKPPKQDASAPPDRMLGGDSGLGGLGPPITDEASHLTGVHPPRKPSGRKS